MFSNLQQRSPTLLFYSFKDQSIMEKTVLSSVHNFLKECAGAPLMITCESHCQPSIQPTEYSQMLNPPPMFSCTYEHLVVSSVEFIKKLIMIICPHFFAKNTTKTIDLWFSIFSLFFFWSGYHMKFPPNTPILIILVFNIIKHLI